jgi:predicted kinase
MIGSPEKEPIFMPDCVMMVGIPYSGKSYYAESMNLRAGRTLISSDEEVHALARLRGAFYNDVFESVVSSAMENAAKRFIEAVNGSQSILLDQTNLTVASRARKLGLLTPDYRKVCVVVPQPTNYELELRKKARTSHSVPDAVLSYMKEIYQAPTVAEGFDVVYTAGFDDIVITT